MDTSGIERGPSEHNKRRRAKQQPIPDLGICNTHLARCGESFTEVQATFNMHAVAVKRLSYSSGVQCRKAGTVKRDPAAHLSISQYHLSDRVEDFIGSGAV